MKKLLCFIGGAMLLMQVHAQQEIEPFYIGDRIPDLPLNRIINYKDSITTLSSFGDRLVVLSFWSIHCKSCIESFQLKDSLQRMYKDKLRIIMVCSDTKEKVLPFLERYNNSREKKFSIPLIYGDSILLYLFRHHSVPHYAWISPTGKLLAQTGSINMNELNVGYMSDVIFRQQQDMYKYHISEDMMRYPKANKSLLDAFQKNKLDKK